MSPGEYVLAVGSANPNKNFKGLLQAFSILRQQLPEETKRMRLVIAGSVGERIFAEAVGQQENVIQTGYVTDGELRALYENTACFVFPSFYEGFGLPLLEAMALGCPAVSSNATPLPALGEGAALFFDPHSPEQMANAISQVLTDPIFRSELSEQGKLRASNSAGAKQRGKPGKFCWKLPAPDGSGLLLARHYEVRNRSRARLNSESANPVEGGARRFPRTGRPYSLRNPPSDAGAEWP